MCYLSANHILCISFELYTKLTLLLSDMHWTPDILWIGYMYELSPASPLV